MAPGANIILVEATNASNANLFAAVTTAKNQPGVVAVSMSFSGDEFSGETSDDSIFTSPANRGVTFLGARGTMGSRAAIQHFRQMWSRWGHRIIGADQWRREL